MTDGAQIAVVVLLAVLVGAALPVLYQLQKSLRSARIVLAGAEERLERSLAQITEAVGRIDRVVVRAEQDFDRLRPFIDLAASLGPKARALQGALRSLATLGVSIGPAMVAAGRAIFAPLAEAEGGRKEPVRAPGGEGIPVSGKGVPAEPEAAGPYRPRGLQPDLAPFQQKEVAHHHG